MLDGTLEFRDIQVEGLRRGPGELPRADIQERLDLGQRVSEVVQLAAQVRQRLAVTRVGPEAAGNLLPEDWTVAMERQVREQLLLPSGEGAARGPSARDYLESAEELEAKGSAHDNQTQVGILARNGRAARYNDERLWPEKGRGY